MTTPFLPEDYKEPTFKDTYGSYDNYLLGILKSSGTIQQSDFDAKKVSGGFINSNIFLLHDGLFKKTVVTAFHIPDQEEKLHHYDIHFVRFRRKNTKSEWTIECVKDLRDKEVEKLKEFISQQNELLGKKVEKRYVKVVATDSPYVLEDLRDVLDKILNLNDEALSRLGEEGYSKLADLFGRLLTSDNVIIDKKLYQEFKNARTSPKSIKKYEDDLKDFKTLVDSDETIETDMQNFLENRVWFFGLNYIQSHRNSKPKFNTTIDSEYDFLLEGFNQVYDIAELKSPNELLIEIEKEGERKRAMDDRVDYMYSAKFSRALHQVIDYMDEFEKFFELIRAKQPSLKPFLYPKGIIVISKRSLFPENGKNSIKYLHLINRQFSNIEILTYDDLFDRGKIIIDFMKGVV